MRKKPQEFADSRSEDMALQGNLIIASGPVS